MIISVVSGKGGAGKTTIATSLAAALAADYYDLDVDAPNGEHFLRPEIDTVRPVTVSHPVIDASRCTGCGLCTQECRFNALYMLIKQVYLNEHLCHSCNLCREVCPSGAISYGAVPIGEVRSGPAARTGAKVMIGDLKIGSTRETALIKSIVKAITPADLVVIDGPPGNSCAAVAAITPADLVVLVVEPTPFGLHDMLQTLRILLELGKPLVVIANKSQGDEELVGLLAEHRLPLALSIPLRSDYHKVLLQGGLLIDADKGIEHRLRRLVLKEVDKP